MFDGKIILITGGTGSWGQCLTKYLSQKDVKEIRIYSRHELSQVEMNRKFNDNRIKFIIGDIRDKNRINEVMKNVDYVFHLAALKHVPICEQQPSEAILTNIIGTINVVEAAINNNVKKVIDVSSDKAVSPYNLYGLTKAVGEKIMITANNKESTTKYVCIRAGNVMGSNGSVIPLFIKQIKEDNSVSITDNEMTRFFITLDEAITLLIKAAEISHGGEILVMRMPALKVIDLAKVLIEEYGNENTIIKQMGIRPGEKLHEELISEIESKYTYKLDDNYYLLVSATLEKDLKDSYSNFDALDKFEFKNFISSNDLLSLKEIRDRLIKGGFIEG